MLAGPDCDELQFGDLFNEAPASAERMLAFSKEDCVSELKGAEMTIVRGNGRTREGRAYYI